MGPNKRPRRTDDQQYGRDLSRRFSNPRFPVENNIRAPSHPQPNDTHSRRRFQYLLRNTHQDDDTKSGSKHNSLRAQARSLEKLLSHVDSNMPTDVRQDKERELAALKVDLQAQDEKKERSAIIKRYHFIRFLERQKAEKTLKKLMKETNVLVEQLENASDEAEVHAFADRLDRVRDRAETARVDKMYAQYAPLGEQYISLFPRVYGKLHSERSENHDVGQDRIQEQQYFNDEVDRELGKDLKAGIVPSFRGEKPPLWFEVAKHALAGEGGLKPLENLRDRSGRGRCAIGNVTGQEGGGHRRKLAATGDQSKRKRESNMKIEEQDESDGGFFE